MPDYNHVHKRLLATLLGVSLMGGTIAYADSRGDGPQFRNSGVTGGFYDDGFTADDWFYDFYDIQSNRNDPRAADRTTARDRNVMRQADMDRLADAAHPLPSSKESPQRSELDTAYSRYYDEPWFYQDRDPAFGMPVTPARSTTSHPAARDEEYVVGVIQSLKHVRNRESGGQNAVALVRTADGRRVIADLGPTDRTLDFAFTQGDAVQIGGQREDIGPYSVLMAHDIKSGANRVRLNRDTIWREADYRQVDGRIENFRDIPIRPNGQLHRTAAVRTRDGHFAIIDMGPSPEENVPANAAPGDRLMATGQVVHVGNYPVMLADRLSINDGVPIRVVRADSEYIDPARRPFEASQEESAADPSCIGGACEAGTVNRSTPRNPLSNAMDGTVGSERR